ncbi:hypothetical protein PSHT_01436 [Puccinia striiformis]|uniref:Uncharacterized protein n=1 Tax=Puccinia striiformis TaxID=27350 RepID=A0A2S4WKP5_9BASI|nr:hypothetical protein PSHT_01436 [Puccinia striiformis]
MQLIFQFKLGTMYCIQCGATPIRMGNWCQSCVSALASIPSTLPAVVIQPPIAQANTKSASKTPTSNPTSLIRPSQPNPNPVAQSPHAQNPVIANSQALMGQMKPYNCPQMVKGTKTPKGSTGKVSQCHVGLRLWYKGQFTPGQAVIWTNQFVLWADPNSFNSLIKTLCKKFNGSIELVTARNKD